MALEVTTTDVDYWALAGRAVVVAGLMSSAVLVFVWRALLRAVFNVGMRESRADFKEFCESEVWKDRMHAVDAALTTVGELQDKVEYLDEAVKQQGRALMDSFTSALTRQTASIEAISTATTDALDRMTKAVDSLARDTSDTREQVANMAGFLRASSGEGFSQFDRRRQEPQR